MTTSRWREKKFVLMTRDISEDYFASKTSLEKSM